MIKSIRLSEFEQNAIVDTFDQFFMPDDELWLFGSRADPSKKGGDIDLYVETTMQDSATALTAKIDFLVQLKKIIGDQKIDLVLRLKNSQSNLLIDKLAKETGVKLK